MSHIINTILEKDNRPNLLQLHATSGDEAMRRIKSIPEIVVTEFTEYGVEGYTADGTEVVVWIN